MYISFICIHKYTFLRRSMLCINIYIYNVLTSSAKMYERPNFQTRKPPNLYEEKGPFFKGCDGCQVQKPQPLWQMPMFPKPGHLGSKKVESLWKCVERWDTGIFTKGFKEVDNLERLWFLGPYSGSALLIGTGDFNQQMMMHGNNFLGRE